MDKYFSLINYLILFSFITCSYLQVIGLDFGTLYFKVF